MHYKNWGLGWEKSYTNSKSYFEAKNLKMDYLCIRIAINTSKHLKGNTTHFILL